MKGNSIIQISLIITVLVLSTILLRGCRQIDLRDQQIKAMSDTTEMYRNKSNQLVAEKLAFVGDKQDLKAEIERWKLYGDTLETKLTNKTKEIFLLKREFSISKSGKVDKTKTDTVYFADIVIDTPSISIDTGDAFHRFKFASNKTKYAYEIKVFDNSELKVEDLGRKGTKVSLLNENPYVISTDLKSVMITPKKQSLFNKIIYVGAGLGIGYLVFK